jgi:hypothetical protein
MFRKNGLCPSSQSRRGKETFQVGNLLTRYSKQEGQCGAQNCKETIYNMSVLKLAYIFRSLVESMAVSTISAMSVEQLLEVRVF